MSQIADDAGQPASDYYPQAYDPGRYSPTMNSGPTDDAQYHNYRDRSRSPDRADHNPTPRSTSMTDNYAPNEYYPTSDTQSLSQREPPGSQRDNNASLQSSQSTLYVRNISLSATEQQLSDLFQQHGTIDSCTFLVNHQTGRPRGVAFVKMSTNAEADAALAALQGTLLDSRPLEIEWARLDKPRDKTPGLYKGQHPTRHNNGDRMRRGGDSYRTYPNDYGREYGRESRDMSRSGHRRHDAFPPPGPAGGRYQDSRSDGYGRSSSYVPRGGHSPVRSRGGRYDSAETGGYGGRDYRSYDRPPAGRSFNDRPDRGFNDRHGRPPFDDGGFSRSGRSGPPSRYPDSAPRGPAVPMSDSRPGRPDGYGAYEGGDRRRF